MQNRRRAHLVLAALALVTVSGLVVARSRVPGKVARRVLHQFAPQPEKATPKAAPVARALPAVPRKFAIKQDIYRGGLRNDWEDWGWSPRQAKGPGPAQIDLSGYGGWILHHPPQKDSYGAVVFRFKAPKEYKDFLEVRTEFDGGGNFTPVVVNLRYRFAQADGWEQAVIPLYELNPYGLEFDRIQIRAHEAVGKQRIQFDQVALSEPLPDAPAPLSYPVHDEAVRVQCELPGHAINPLIFGAAQMKVAADMGPSAYRLGGNPMTRFNWKLGNVWNTASDWYFLNVRLDWDWRGFVQMAEQRGAEPVMTVPIIGWVAKDESSYSFPVSVFGPQQDVESDKPDRGNGNNKAGKPIKPGSPSRTSIEATPEFVAEWVQTMRRESEARGKHKRAYILDNEPNLWNSTHRDVHPAPLTYDELMDRTIRYGAAVRAADPSASIAGPAEWGWSNYFWSAKDLEAGVGSAPDRRAHGDVPLLEWYLKKLREYEQSGKPRILDLLDVHFYPQGKGLYGEAADPDAAARRIRSTRALWDPTYVDESWIKEPVRLLPRMKELVARNYPGLGISIGEWNFGAENHISGGIAVAEALGRFAEAGITSAYYWSAPPQNSPAYWAFRAYRNFDGKGATFLERYVPSKSSQNLSVFASRDASGTRLIAVIVHPEEQADLRATFDVSRCGNVRSWQTRVYSQKSGLSPSKSGQKNAIVDTFPAYSFGVLEIELEPPAPKPQAAPAKAAPTPPRR